MSRFFFFVSVGCLLFASVGSVACTEHTMVHVPARDVFTLEKSCAQTACQANNQNRSDDCARCQSQCDDLVLEGCDPSSVCAVICTNPSCTDDASDTLCAKTTWTAHVSLQETAGLADACVRFQNTFNEECAEKDVEESSAVSAQCKVAARFGTDALLRTFDCRLAARCDVSAIVACNSEQTSTFGDELCNRSDASCSSFCDDSARQSLNEIAPALKPVVLEAARTCAAQPRCADASECMKAWQEVLSW